MMTFTAGYGLITDMMPPEVGDVDVAGLRTGGTDRTRPRKGAGRVDGALIPETRHRPRD
jgi:hypothetical protein